MKNINWIKEAYTHAPADENGKRRPLTKEEEADLFQQLRDKKEGAFEKIFYAYVNVVERVAYRFRGNDHYPMEDIASDAAEALMRCIPKFDMDKGVRFYTYALKYVTGEVTRKFTREKNGSAPDISDYQWNISGKIDKFRNNYYMEHGRYPTDKETAYRMGFRQSTVQNASPRAMEPARCIDGTDCNHEEDAGDSGTVHLYSSVTGTSCPEDTVSDMRPGSYLQGQISGQMEAIIKEYLTPFQQDVLCYRFGLFGKPQMNEYKVAETLGIDAATQQMELVRTLILLEEPFEEMGLRNAIVG